MVLKKKPSDPWPLITGEYEAGNPENPVAVCSCGSHLKASELLAVGASLVGPCKTENIGIEKMVANMVSNPNIRYMVITGMEVKGHITGQAIEAFLKDGVDKEGRIVGAKGAIPFIQNLSEESIERVKQQVQPIIMMDTEDMGTIKAKVQELVSKDPGALDVEPMRIEIKEGGEEEGRDRPNAYGRRSRFDNGKDAVDGCSRYKQWTSQQVPGRHLRGQDRRNCSRHDLSLGLLWHNPEDGRRE